MSGMKVLVFVLGTALAPEGSIVESKTVQSRDVVQELSEARQNPKAYARHLRALLEQFEGRLWRRPGQITIRTEEGRSAVEEAIAFLERQRPLGPLGFSSGLARAAQDHAADQGSGRTGHVGSRGQTMEDRIQRYGQFQGMAGENINYGPASAREIAVQLIIDDGVPGRGHRKNIFNPAFRAAGAAVGPHATYGHVCVIDFADGFQER